MGLFSRKKTEAEQVRPDQVDRLMELMGQERLEEIVEEEIGNPSYRGLNRVQALLSAAERSSSQAEIDEARRRNRLF
jgi:hypothetical protein